MVHERSSFVQFVGIFGRGFVRTRLVMRERRCVAELRDHEDGTVANGVSEGLIRISKTR